MNKVIPFHELQISTKTLIVFSNLQFDIQKISDQCEKLYSSSISHFKTIHHESGQHRLSSILLPKEENHKNSHQLQVLYESEFPINIYSSMISFVSCYYKKSFRNALNIVYHVKLNFDGDDESVHKIRKVNIKVHKNGKFQLTGCKYTEFAKWCLFDFITRICHHLSDCVQLQTSNQIHLYFQTVMTNVDFSLGFAVDRQKLDWRINKSSDYYSLLETSFGYTGVNIKFPLEMKWWETQCPHMFWNPFVKEHLTIQHDYVAMNTFVDKEIIDRLLKKGKYNTFLVFHSGKVIMSGMFLHTMESDYYRFLDIIGDWKPMIEEKIEITPILVKNKNESTIKKALEK